MTKRNPLSRSGQDKLEPALPSAKAEATRCLFCFDAPCKADCPAGIDVPGFIRRIMQDNVQGAYRLIRDENPLSWVCSVLCPTEKLCASRCPRRLKDRSIDIGGLQAHACRENRPRVSPAKEGGNGRGPVAVVGAGPAGLTVAWYLLEQGFSIDLYEAEEQPGGLVIYGIRPDKMDKGRAVREIAGLLRHPGISAHWKARIEDPRSLLKSHSAVYVATGLGKEWLDESAARLRGVWPATAFLREVNTAFVKGRSFKKDLGESVLVIGGGNTAIDAAITARLAGASNVTIIYRRTEREMPVRRHEFETALLHGIHIRFLLEPVSFRGKAGKIDKVLFRPTGLGRPGRDGRRRVIPGRGPNVSIPASTVILATGREREKPEWARDEKIDPFTGRVEKSRIWIGGELRQGAGLVVEAVSDGKRAAREIIKALGEKR